MKTRYLIGAAVAAAFMSSTALAQTAAPPAKAPAPAATEAAPKLQSPHWRASKLIGVKIYNDQNERLGDINEIIFDQNGKAQGYVVGVGGFLGMGEHDIFVAAGEDQVRERAGPHHLHSARDRQPSGRSADHHAQCEQHGRYRPCGHLVSGSRHSERHQGSAQGDAAVQVQQLQLGVPE